MPRWRCTCCHQTMESHSDAPYCSECWEPMQPVDPAHIEYVTASDEVPDELREIERIMQEPRSR